MNENEIMHEMPKNDTPEVKKLSIPQEINIISGILFLILMPLGLGIAFTGNINITYWIYVIFFFDYLFWFFTSHTVYGTFADKNTGKYKTLDYISRICVTICPLYVIFVMFSYSFTYSNTGVVRDILEGTYPAIICIAIAIFSLCRYLEVLFVILDIRKALSFNQQKAK